jgi:hypothetical protein
MLRTTFRNVVIGLAACATLAGCATTQEGQDQASGALIGCAGGAIVGALLGNTRGAVAGCAAGALVGWGTVKMTQYNASQSRSGNTDEDLYRRSDPDFYALDKPVSDSTIKIRGATASPDRASAGTTIVAVTDYSLITPKNSATIDVQESWALKKDGKQLVELKPRAQTRSTGGWESRAEFPVPQDADPGTYVIEHKVKAGSSYDKRVSVFVVG